MAGETHGRSRWMGFNLGALAALSPIMASAAGPADLYYDRAVMVAADQRCRLFEPALGSALAASTAQARGAALRAGVEDQALRQVQARAQGAAARVACNSADMNTVASRVRTAFNGYAKVLKMPYPGEIAGWNADRSMSQTQMVWSLSQRTVIGTDPVTFGIAARNGAYVLAAMTKFTGQAPYAARIVMRDTVRSSRPYLDVRQARADGKLPLPARVTPRYATRTFMAEGRFAPDPLMISADGRADPRGYVAWRFPVGAAQALADLDPREAVEVEFLFSTSGADIIRKAYVEVGDFAAGRAFLLVQR